MEAELETALTGRAISDYHRIAAAIAFIRKCAHSQPTLEEIAAHVHLSPYHFQRLFSRWAGITPKRFLQVLTLEHAKHLLRESRSLLDVSDSVGLSSSSRLHDHFIQLDAVTPGDFKRGGAGLTIQYAVHATPFGDTFVATTERGVCSLAFLDEEGPDIHLDALRQQWPHATAMRDTAGTRPIIDAMLGREKPGLPLSLYVSGTNFQTNVWRALLQIPMGSVMSYSQLAASMGRPNAARSVASAIAANPIAFLIPCHRVIRESGKVGEYHWGGQTRKQALLAWETRHRPEETLLSGAKDCDKRC